MTNIELGTKIRSVFYIILGIVFSFFFVLISYHIELNEKLMTKNGEMTLRFLVDGLEANERYIYEDFSIANYQSIQQRIQKFLESKKIKNFSLVVFDELDCALGLEGDCDRFSKYVSQGIERKIHFTKALDSIFIKVPVNLWERKGSFLGLEIREEDIFYRQNFSEIIFFRIFPFFLIILLVIYFYFYAEKKIIIPAISKIIQAESLRVQKNILRQFTHDIRSPLSVVDEMFNLDYEKDEEVSTLLRSSLGRVLEMSQVFLSESKISTAYLNVDDLINLMISEKKIEFRHLSPKIIYKSNLENNFLKINKAELSRSLSNILNNAIEATKFKTPQIELIAKKKFGILEIEVTDNGEGISIDNLKLIESGNFSTKKEGHGLGILGVKNWLRQINGSLQIKSTVGAGTSVLLSIPEDE